MIRNPMVIALCSSLGLAASSTSYATPSTSSDYFTDTQNSHVQDNTSDGIDQVNMITCFMGAMRPDALVNEGNYIALVDEAKCDSAGRDSTSNSGSTNSGASAAQYVTASVNSSRTSTTDPMIGKIWVDLSEQGQAMQIFVHTSATEAPDDTNAFGVFRMDYCGLMVGGDGSCMFNGFIDANADGLDYYETGEGGARTIALNLTSNSTTSGEGSMDIQDSFAGNKRYSFAFDAGLFRRSDGTSDVCFSRDATDSDTGFSVWRYGLYNATTGARVDRNSGFPIDYTANGTTYHGFVGYYGLSLPDDANIASGATVSKVEYSSGQPVTTDYNLFKASGKLTQHTRATTTLSETDKIRFGFFASSPNAPAGFGSYVQGTNYQTYWDETNKRFVIVGYDDCTNGCKQITLSSPVNLSINYMQTEYSYGIFGWSQSIGGNIFIDVASLAGNGSNSSAVNVAYRVENVVYPSDYASIGDLVCIADCPSPSGMVANPTVAYVPGTGNNYSATALGSLVSYTLNAATGNMELSSVAASAAGAELSDQYQWGIRSGHLFPTSAASAVDAADGSTDNSFNEFSVDSLSVYYVWETGPNNWNQFSGLQDADNNFVSFDPPLNLSFSVPDDAAKYGDSAGKTIMLQYGGFGDLWGIPGYCVNAVDNQPVSCDDSQARYVPEFIVPFDETTGVVSDGSNSYLVKWLDREIRFAEKPLNVCTSAGLTLPSGDNLPTSAELENPSDPNSALYIGDKPIVTDAPRVIHGDVQY